MMKTCSMYDMYTTAHGTYLKTVNRVQVGLSRRQPHDRQAAVGFGHHVRRRRLATAGRARSGTCADMVTMFIKRNRITCRDVVRSHQHL